MNDHPIDQEEIVLHLILYRLLSAQRPTSRESIISFASLKLPKVEKHYDRLVQSMLHRGLASGDGNDFELTPAGKDAIAASAREYSLTALFYNEYYQAVLSSPAHAEFCERVYGKDLAQHGMTNMDQLHSMLAALGLEPGMSLMDFGCGDGRISEYIAGLTGASVTGVDIATEAIHLAKSRTGSLDRALTFSCADIEMGQGDFPPGPFNAIIAIDSLFFAYDLRFVTKALFDRLAPGGKLGVFFHAPPGVAGHETDFARVLADLQLPYQFKDLSAANSNHWALKKSVLQELEPRFAAEGNLFLYRNRMAECESNLGSFERYRYLISNSGE